ncbi:carboxymuconolactone decarboxylase family protein [Labrenzia sp. 011]|uniref:carboxymuconolactone decarboxylase family protein n=1 Tax=Labrenzia sp. 011 TaxID=2171494 RepID=UPI000D517818|nr:carboxymuconolactone decarboxylase family protein [Labrenzia sp. 011]PVB59570.1 carboxymuconolactone decarboxylase [Labrenzia sp. 011]
MAISDWTAFVEQTDARMAAVRKGAPDVAKGFGALAAAATKPGALDAKTKELIALAIGITARCDGCLAYHARAAARHGASREEVIEVIGVAVYMGGGPSMIYGAEALAAFDGLAEASGG